MSRAELFSNMAKGLFSLITPLTHIRNRERHNINVVARSVEELLVSWLNELIFVHETKGLLFRYFDIQLLTQSRLEADCSGEKIDPARHILNKEIKAATYHRLLIKEGPKGLWRAQVIFDV